MHGLVNRSIQCFIEDTYGAEIWDGVVRDTRLDFRDFEAMLVYDDTITFDVLDAACKALDKPRDALLDDLGTYLVTHKNMEAVRRLLRFGGHSFEEFLYSLDDLHDRAQLAIPDLDLPQLELLYFTPQSRGLTCTWTAPGYGSVLMGVLRALADDYGSLVLLDMDASKDDGGRVVETIKIELLEHEFASGRSFSLAAVGNG